MDLLWIVLTLALLVSARALIALCARLEPKR